MIELFQLVVKQHASQIAVRYGNKSMTFQELDDCSNRIARLILDHGISPDDCPFIGLYSSRSFYTVPMMFGVLKAGFAYVPMEAKYSSERIDYIINDCKLKLILTDGDFLATTHTGAEWLPITQEVLSAVVPQSVNSLPSRYAYVIYTSGTTGKPKGTPITRQALLNLVEARKDLIPPQENTTELCLASIVFDVSVWEVFCSLLTGSSIYFISEAEKSDPQRIADLLEEQHISTFNITPTHLSVIPYRQFPDLKYLVFAGEPCPQELIRKWQNTCTVIDAYGPTEATVIATACVHHQDTLANDIGLPLRGVTCYVLDEKLSQVPTGEKGELYIGGIQLTDGYLNKEELNRQKFISNPYASEGASDPILYASGDIVYRQPSDNHIIYCGRKDSQVKIHGFRIELGEVKTNLESCANINAAAVEVIGQGQRKRLRAYVTGKQKPVDMNLLKSELKGKLPSYMIPAQLVEVNLIPKNINGKTDFKALASMMPLQQEEDVLENDVERQLAAIWHEVLDYSGSILSSSNFLEIGGDSISLILMLQKVNQSFGVLLSVDDAYNNLVISNLAQKVATFIPNVSEPVNHRLHTSESKLPLPAHMQTLLTHCLLNQQASLAYNLVELIPFEPSLNTEKLLEAWNKILQKQDAFRMTFHRDSFDVPFVQIHEYVLQTSIPIAEIAGDEALCQTIIQRLSQPFNLDNGPLYHTELYHLSDGRWLFAVYVHHLISDGWSLDEMHKQVYALYQANDIPAVTPFADYLTETWQREQSPSADESKTYWDSYLADSQELLLPGILFDSDTGDYVTGCVATRIDKQLTDAIRHYCASHQLTLFSFMSTALQLLMHRVSRQSDFTIGYPTSGRSEACYFDTLGYFVHPRPMKFTVDMLDLTFAELCKHTLHEIRCAELHPDAMVKLPSVNFTLETMRQETRLGISLPYALAPLTLTVDDDDESLQCRWLYRQSLADTQQIECLSRYYLHLLQNVVRSSDTTLVRRLSLQSAEEYAAMVSLNTVSPLQQPVENVVDVFRSQVQTHPNHLALKDAVSTYTYQQLDVASDVIARTLTSHSVTACAVGLFFERSNMALIAMMGIIKAGCFYVPISPTYPEKRIREIVQDSGMRCILANKNVSGEIAAICSDKQCLCIEDLLASPQESTQHPEVNISQESPAYMIYTSGTTGVPKGVIVTHSNIVSMVKIGSPKAYGITSDDRVIQVSTYLFDASVIDIFTTLLNGALLITAADELKEDPDRLFHLMEAESVTWACLPPSYLHACDHDATTSLKTILVGGESPSQTIINRYRHIRFINGYGPTENTVCSTSHTYSADSTASSACIGKPLDGVTCYVLDDDRNPLPDGITGELFLGGLQLASGYHQRAELNEKSFIPNPFVSKADEAAGINTRLYATGDMVYRHSDGNLYFVGRKDHQVKIRGYRIELGDIANTLLRHIAVHQCVVEARTIGSSKQLVAHVETDSLQLTGGVLRTYLSDKLPTYMIPSYWSFSRHFPLTPNGKIDYSRLPEPELYIAQKDKTDDDMNQEEMKCISIVARLLGADMSAIHPDDNVISDLGMTSLHVLEFASIMQHRGYNLHPSEIYRFKTIRQVVDFYTSNESHQTMTAEQINSRICYFTSPEDKNKPLLLVVSGYPYYETEYFDFDNYFKKDYNILVIESANEYYMYHPDEPLTIDALMKGYVELLRPLLKDRELAGVTGLCIGGDMGLRLAVELNELHLAHPKVFVIDGYAKRTSYAKGLGSFVSEPGIDSDVNLRRNEIMRQMTDTFEQKYYPGEVYLMMTTHFGDENGQTKEEGEAIHPTNKKNWLEAQPDVYIDYLDGLHMELLHNPHDLEQIKSIIDRHLL